MESCDSTCSSARKSCNDLGFQTLNVGEIESIFEDLGNACTSVNTWDFNQGPSQCTSENCCDGNCINACSLPENASCDQISDDGDYRRLCPCSSFFSLMCVLSFTGSDLHSFVINNLSSRFFYGITFSSPVSKPPRGVRA